MWGQVSCTPDFAAHLIDKYDSLQMKGLKITAELGKPYAAGVDGTIHFDALLAYAVMQSLGDAVPVLDKAMPLIFPVPLKIEWVSSEGLPLLLSTDMLPEGEWASGVDYWHKKFPQTAVQRHCKQPNTQIAKGVFKEYRIPIKTIAADSISAFCVGNAEEIEMLLSYVTFVGKKRSQGRGMILNWRVEESEIIKSEILKKRPVPIEYSKKAGGSVMGWCAPYWFRPHHAAC